MGKVSEMGTAFLYAALYALCCSLVYVQDTAEAIPAPEKQHHKKPSRGEREEKKSLLNPLHLHKPLLYVAYWILQAQSLLGAVCRAHS